MVEKTIVEPARKKLVNFESKETRIWVCPMCRLENVQFIKEEELNLPKCNDCETEFEWGEELL